MTIAYDPKTYLNAVRDQFSKAMDADTFRKVMRTAAKRVAKHHGHISKYDGQGRLREGFPAAGDTGGRPTLPNKIETDWSTQRALVCQRKARSAKRRSKAYRTAFSGSTGPSRKMFVDRTDGGRGDYHV